MAGFHIDRISEDIRKQLGSRLHLRKSPELRFIADDSIEKGMDLFEKIKEITHED